MALAEITIDVTGGGTIGGDAGRRAGLILLICFVLAFALEPDSPWLEILAAGFGIGCGLTLDEWALILHLEDVYWAEEGRRSIDAVIMATLVGAAVVVGLVPWQTD